MKDSAVGKNKNTIKRPFRQKLIAIILILTLLSGTLLVYWAQIREFNLEFANTLLEQAYTVATTDAYRSKNLLERAWDILTKCVFKPRNYQEYETYASVNIAKGDYANATKYIQGCIDTYKGQSNAELAALWMRKGSLYTLIGENDSAIECLDTAIGLDETLSTAYLLRAQVKSQKGDAAAAAEDLRKYEALVGPDPVIQAAMGGLYESIEDYKSAAQCYRMAVDSGNYEVATLASLARCEILAGDADAGYADLERYFAEGGTDETGDLNALLGMCRADRKDYAGALTALHKAIDLGYENKALLYKQCVACAYAVEDFDSVIADGEKAIEYAEENGSTEADVAQIYQWIGLSHFIRNDFEKAKAAFEKVLEYDDTVPNIHYYVGVCCLSIGQLEDAVRHLRISAVRGEFSSVCFYDSALCHIQMQEYGKAMTDLQAAITAADDDDAVAQAKTMLEEIRPHAEEEQLKREVRQQLEEGKFTIPELPKHE